MGLEVSSYIAGLTSSWPVSGDPKSQGDDHIRLIKSVLQTTFPNANKQFRFPGVESLTTTGILTALQFQNSFVRLDTAGGNFNVTLPSLATDDAGWTCSFVKVSGDANAAFIYPASGQILTQAYWSGNVRIGCLATAAKLVWDGSSSLCMKDGPPVGSTVDWDGPSMPLGYLVLDGTSYASMDYQELAYMYGTTPAVGVNFTLRDKRGRVDVGVDGGTGRITGIMGGTLASVGGSATHTLTSNEVAKHNHPGLTENTDRPEGQSHSHVLPNATKGGTSHAGAQGGAGLIVPISSGGVDGNITIGTTDTDHKHYFTTNTQLDGGAAHANMQPTIVTNKLVRAC